MDQTQIIAQTINDIDDFVARLSDKIDNQTLDAIKEYKNQIKNNVDSGNINIAEEFCAKAILFMQNYEISLIEKQQEEDKKKMLADLMFQTNNISINSSVIDGKIVNSQTSFMKNLYYKYFYKGESKQSEFDDNKFIFDILDNLYQLLILSSIVFIIFSVFINYDNFEYRDYYNIYTVGYFGFAIWLCKITKTVSNISIIIDLFIIGCFAFIFWFSKLFFALS